MKDKISKHLKKRFPLCDDAYFDKVAGEIEVLYIEEGWMKVNISVATSGYCRLTTETPPFIPLEGDELSVVPWIHIPFDYYDDPLARIDRYFEDDQGIVDTVIVK